MVKVLPELAPYQMDAANFIALGRTAQFKLSLPVRFSALTGALDEARLAALVARARVPNDCRDLAQLYLRHRATFANAMQLDAAGLADLIQSADGLRQEARFLSLIAVANIFAQGDVAANTEAACTGATKRLNVALSAA